MNTGRKNKSQKELIVTDEEFKEIVDYVEKNKPIFPKQYYKVQKDMIITDTKELFYVSPQLPLKQVLIEIMNPLPDFLTAKNLIEVTQIIITTWEELQKKIAA